MIDLRIHIQNKCIGRLTGHSTPERVPLDPNLPRIREDLLGQLGIFVQVVDEQLKTQNTDKTTNSADISTRANASISVELTDLVDGQFKKDEQVKIGLG